ncbi:MAG: hypothetical protein ACLP9L_11900 [Thermoguttaceae bacterium]
MKDYLPPGYIRRIGDKRFPRFVICDCRGQYWARDHWSRKPAHAVLFHSEIQATEARNRYCLGSDEADTFTVSVVLAVHARRWSVEELARHLERHRQFFVGGPAEKEGLLLEIIPSTLKKVDGILQ